MKKHKYIAILRYDEESAKRNNLYSAYPHILRSNDYKILLRNIKSWTNHTWELIKVFEDGADITKLTKENMTQPTKHINKSFIKAQEYKKLREEGKTYQYIASIYNVSKQAVHSLLKEHYPIN